MATTLLNTDATLEVVCTMHNNEYVKYASVRYAYFTLMVLNMEQAHCPEGMGGCRTHWRLRVTTKD
jgi:hypothetical protein